MDCGATRKGAGVTKDEKRDRFLRLSRPRLRRAVAAMRVLGRCGNRTNYDYTAEEAAEVYAGLNAALVEVREAFSGPKEDERQLKLLAADEEARR